MVLGAHNNNHIKIQLSLNRNMFWNSLTIIIIIVSFIYTHLFWMAFIISKNEQQQQKNEMKIVKMATL